MDDADLKRVAKAATPGPWFKISDAEHPANRRITSDHRPHIAKVYGTHMGDESDGEANATYIATFDPPTVLSLLSRLSAAEARVGVLEEALTWYAEQVAGCRKITSEGDVARQSLDRDGGQRARKALTQETSREPE